MVTTLDGTGAPRGLTANSFTSVSLNPPLLLVCIAKNTGSYSAFAACRDFTIHVLAEEQRWLSELFASKAPDKFDRAEWWLGPLRTPSLPGCLARFECAAAERHDAGDHMILLGRVVAFDLSPGSPLAYGLGGYISLGLTEEALARSHGRAVVTSCIAERNGAVILLQEGGAWRLPFGWGQAQSGRQVRPVLDLLTDLGLEAEIGFLFSVFEAADGSGLQIVFRAQVLGGHVTPPGREFTESEIPWELLAPMEAAGMLRRFFHELETDQFGIYADLPGVEARVARLGTEPDSWEKYALGFSARESADNGEPELEAEKR